MSNYTPKWEPDYERKSVKLHDSAIVVADVYGDDENELRQRIGMIALAPELVEVCRAIAALSDGQGRMNLMEIAGWARQVLARIEEPTP